jgi:acetyltransferase-like isoleucine patch superfamily enzyme
VIARELDWRRELWQLRWRRAPRLASRARVLVARGTHQHATVVLPPSTYAGPGFRLEIPGAAEFVVGDNVSFRRGFYCEIAPGGTVRIGAGSTFTGDAMVQISTSLDIGERCVFGQATFIADGSHRFRDWTHHVLDQGYDFRPITIEDNAFILTKCTIVADIGRGAVIAANSLVNRPVPAYSLAGGVPAKVLEYFGPEPGDD